MINFKRPFVLFFLFSIGAFFFALIGCSENSISSAQKHGAVPELKTIVVTTTQIFDLVKQIAGDHCKVLSLMGPGVDPHLYKPTARDMLALNSADLILFHGLKLEGKISTVLKYAKDSMVPIHEVCSKLPSNLLLASNEEGQMYPDPHVWFSPPLWIMCMQRITNILGDLIPEKKELFQKRSRKLEQEYSMINQWAKVQFSRVIPARKKIITSHDAFRYLGRSFDLDVIALQGISTATEAGLGDRANLVDYIRLHKVPVLFVESSVNPRALEEVAKETGAVLGKPLFSDALGANDQEVSGPDGFSYALSTWTGMMIYNVNAIVEGLTKREDE